MDQNRKLTERLGHYNPKAKKSHVNLKRNVTFLGKYTFSRLIEYLEDYKGGSSLKLN